MNASNYKKTLYIILLMCLTLILSIIVIQEYKINQKENELYYLETVNQTNQQNLLILQNQNNELQIQNNELETEKSELKTSLTGVEKSLKSCTRDSETYKNRWNSCTNVKGFADFWHNEILNKNLINGLFVTNNEI
jgi:chromosome segregation ATPase